MSHHLGDVFFDEAADVLPLGGSKLCTARGGCARRSARRNETECRGVSRLIRGVNRVFRGVNRLFTFARRNETGAICINRLIRGVNRLFTCARRNGPLLLE